MKWTETVANGCRYGENAGNIWGDWEVLWESSEADYSGSADFVAYKDGLFVLYDWSYGYCSGCDEWESLGLGDDEIEAEMRHEAVEYDIDGMVALVAKTPNAPWVSAVLPLLPVP